MVRDVFFTLRRKYTAVEQGGKSQERHVDESWSWLAFSSLQLFLREYIESHLDVPLRTWYDSIRHLVHHVLKVSKKHNI